MIGASDSIRSDPRRGRSPVVRYRAKSYWSATEQVQRLRTHERQSFTHLDQRCQFLPLRFVQQSFVVPIHQVLKELIGTLGETQIAKGFDPLLRGFDGCAHALILTGSVGSDVAILATCPRQTEEAVDAHLEFTADFRIDHLAPLAAQPTPHKLREEWHGQ
jgi:hypothetical protein